MYTVLGFYSIFEIFLNFSRTFCCYRQVIAPYVWKCFTSVPWFCVFIYPACYYLYFSPIHRSVGDLKDVQSAYRWTLFLKWRKACGVLNKACINNKVKEVLNIPCEGSIGKNLIKYWLHIHFLQLREKTQLYLLVCFYFHCDNLNAFWKTCKSF